MWIKEPSVLVRIIKLCHLMYVNYFRTCIVKLESLTLILNILSKKASVETCSLPLMRICPRRFLR